MDYKEPIVPFVFDQSLIDHKFITIDIPGEPFGKQRPRATKKGKYLTIYTPRETKLYEEKVRKEYNNVWGLYNYKLQGALTADIVAYFSIPNSVSKKKKEEMLSGKISHTKKPDCDNIGKICLDGLNDIAYPDDAAIDKLNVSKKYGEVAKVRITIIENKKISEG